MSLIQAVFETSAVNHFHVIIADQSFYKKKVDF